MGDLRRVVEFFRNRRVVGTTPIWFQVIVGSVMLTMFLFAGGMFGWAVIELAYTS